MEVTKARSDARAVINRMNLVAARRGDLVVPRHRSEPGAERRAERRAQEPPPAVVEGALEPEAGESPAALTVIVPTRNEQENVEPLVRRLATALAGREARVLFVDDSDDGTPAEVARVAAAQAAPDAGPDAAPDAAAEGARVPAGSGLLVELLHRPRHQRTGGLGGAVLAGLRRTTTPWAVVMDGDLQHPPELVPELIDAGQRAAADVVVASRHIAGGSATGLSGATRVLVSGLSITLSKLAFPKRLKGISDPMSGFFALRTAAFHLDHLRPEGFKILLELLARNDRVVASEVPFVFGERHAGKSKASLREGLLFGFQLLRLRLARIVTGPRRPGSRGTGSHRPGSPQPTSGGPGLRRPRVLRPGFMRRGVGFAAVGATGIFVNLAVMWMLADPAALAINYLVAAVIATQVSSSWNFALVDTVVYRGRKRLTVLRRWLGFMAMSNAVLLLRIPLLGLLVSVLHIHYLIATVLTLFLGYAVRFQSQERLTLLEEPS